MIIIKSLIFIKSIIYTEDCLDFSDDFTFKDGSHISKFATIHESVIIQKLYYWKRCREGKKRLIKHNTVIKNSIVLITQ